jgi:RNA polymerase sigma factor (sigma-70 family)
MESEIIAKLESLSPTLKKIAARYATDKIDADDIYQGIVEKVLKTCSPEDTKSYICQLATWTARNIVNAELIYMRYVTTVKGEETGEEDETLDISEIFVDSNAVSPEDHLIEYETSNELAEILSTVIDDLDDTNRTIIGMLMQGKTHQAIADALDLTRTAISNRVRGMRGTFQMAGISPAYVMA